MLIARLRYYIQAIFHSSVNPFQSFMVWKLAKESTNGLVTKPSPHLQYRGLTKDVLGELISDQLKSTYQSDFMGIPQG